MFTDRRDAGRQLADAVAKRGFDADLVLGIPRGGLPLAAEVARTLDAPLSIIAAKKLGAPNNPEYAIGAAAANGSVFLDEDAIDALGIGKEYVDRETDRALAAARKKVETYLPDGMPDFEGQTVVIVDDGAATGATAITCLRAVKEGGADGVVIALPVSSQEAARDLEREADAVVILETPAAFRAVGAHYRDFSQVSDEEAREYLTGEFGPT